MSPRALLKSKLFLIESSERSSREVIMKTYYVYILNCSDNLLYTGITNNVERTSKRFK